MKKFGVILLCLVGMFMFTGAADAYFIELTLGEFSSPHHDPGTYYDPYEVGVFNFDIGPGQVIVSAEISGQWGNSAMPTTAHNLLFVDTLEVADTHDYSPDPYYTPYTNWSYSFTDFSVLMDGYAHFMTVQTSEYVVRLGETTLKIEVVPEPGTMLLLGSGLIGLLVLGRKKFSKK